MFIKKKFSKSFLKLMQLLASGQTVTLQRSAKKQLKAIKIHISDPNVTFPLTEQDIFFLPTIGLILKLRKAVQTDVPTVQYRISEAISEAVMRKKSSQKQNSLHQSV